MTLTQINSIGSLLDDRRDFTAGGLRAGRQQLSDLYYRGRLGEHLELEQAFLEALDRHGTSLYVVRSHQTPIAWAGPNEPLTVPDAYYSPTTSHHQAICRSGW